VLSTNITLDGFIDHTAMTADEEAHRYYIEEIRQAGALLFGRVNYELFLDAWPQVLKDPASPPDMHELAEVIENVPKIVFSRTLERVDWSNSFLYRRVEVEEIKSLKAATDGDLVIGSGAKLARSFIELGLVDEYKLMLHPVVLGRGLSLFDGLKVTLELIGTRVFNSGSVALHYQA
jgi:dihydrofolate reductase